MKIYIRIVASLLILALGFAANPVPARSLHASSISNEPVFPDASATNQAVCAADALIVFDRIEFQQLELAIQLIRDDGGCVVHVFPPQAIIGSLTFEAEASLKIKGYAATIFRSTVPSELLTTLPDNTAIAGAVWNQQLDDRNMAPQLQSEQPGEPLVGDVRQAELPLIPETPETPDAPGYYDVSEFLYGKIAVGIILPESNGSIDPSTENWSASRMNLVVSEIQDAMSWYAGTFPASNLTFYYDIHLQVPTGYEPISRSSDDDTLWIQQSFNALGYSGPWSSQSYSYLNSIRSAYHTDWALVALVVDSYNDPDGKFTDEFFGYTYGYLIVMSYDNDGWGISRMNNVMAHEMAHNFGAADEYCSPDYSCCWGGGQYGYLGIPNPNCEAGCDNNDNGVCDGNDETPNSNCHNCPTCVQVSCLMRTGSVSSGMDTPSRNQIGVRDTDNDGLYDPVDTIPSLSISAYSPDPTVDNTPTYTGSAADVPYNSPTQPDISLNFIERARYQVDGGSWQDCSATDGNFDETAETFTCQIAELPDGSHTIQFQARNRVMNLSSLWSDTLMIDANPPTNPNHTDPGCNARNNIWQNTCNDPSFTWTGASDAGTGVAGYYIYWGQDAAGTSSNFIYFPSYDPRPIRSPETSYLRVQTKDNIGNLAPWVTLFILRYDENVQLIPRLFLPVIMR